MLKTLHETFWRPGLMELIQSEHFLQRGCGRKTEAQVWQADVVACARHLIEVYRRFLKTSYRLLDDNLRQQFETQLSQADVVVRVPNVTLSRDFQRGATLRAVEVSFCSGAVLSTQRLPAAGQRQPLLRGLLHQLPHLLLDALGRARAGVHDVAGDCFEKPAEKESL